MRMSLKLAVQTGAATTIASLTLPAVAGADPFSHGDGGSHLSAVYVQTNDPTGNQIVTYLSGGHGLHEVGRTDAVSPELPGHTGLEGMAVSAPF